MKVNAVNNNFSQPNFGAKIKFEKPIFQRTMPNIADFAEAKKILDEFKMYPVEDTVLIKLVKAENKYDSCLEAFNTKTKGVMKYRLTPEDAEKDFENEETYGGCSAFYSLLKDLLDKNNMLHKDFWSPKNFAPSLRPSEHSVFSE